MNRKAFHQLLQRYVEGKCSLEERQLIDQWYELLDSENHFEFSATEMDEIEERIWERIKIEEPLKKKSSTIPIFSPKIRSIKKWLVAASIIIVAGSVFLLVRNNKTKSDSIIAFQVQKGFLEFTNASDTISNISLEDKSIISLHPHSSIAYPKHFASDKREIYLEGEAFFKVFKNASRPFFVYNNNVVTEDLGTSFDVKGTDVKVVVCVKTGKVAVYENVDKVILNSVEKKENGVIITPNQKVTYYNSNRQFVTAIVDEPMPLICDNNNLAQKISFVFDDTPLSKVISALEKEYGLEIVVSDESLNNRLFTGDITKPDLNNKLELICQAIGAKYEMKGTHILIKKIN